MIPSSVTALMKTSVSVATLLASRQADWSPSVAMRLRKRGDERGGERAFGKKIAQHVGRAERGQERVHVFARAEKRGENHFANQARERGCTKSAMPTTPVARVLTRCSVRQTCAKQGTAE